MAFDAQQQGGEEKQDRDEKQLFLPKPALNQD